MDHRKIARASIVIDAPRDRVWRALVTPADIRHYMFGTDALSDFKPGSPITWKGQWQGKPYEDRGTILESVPGRLLRYTHFSPLAGLPDEPGNYHTVTIALDDATTPGRKGLSTKVLLTQDNNPTDEARAHSEQNWSRMLAGLKKHLKG